MNPHIVIVGAGQAGLQAGETLRAAGFDGQITLLGEEPHLPYHRPPLSKAWLAGTMDAGALTMRTAMALERKKITVRTGARVGAIDTAARLVRLDDGSSLPYSGLLLATGATPRSLPCSAGARDAVRVLRSLDDANAVSARLRRCAERGLPLVVVGGGFIGLEVAATARQLGVEVTILEAAPRLLERVLARPMSEWYARLHTGHGARLVLDARIAGIEGTSSDVVDVHLADGRTFTAGLVLVGIGVTPNDALAREAGIECSGGIVVDAWGRTSVAGVTAAGDCTIRRTDTGEMLRLESVQNAVEQGRTAASTLLGLDRPFAAIPWFWSDQHDRKLQIAGLSRDADAWAVRGDMALGGFSVFHFRAKRLIAVDSIDAPQDHLLARKLLAAGVSPTETQAADTTLDLATLIPSA